VMQCDAVCCSDPSENGCDHDSLGKGCAAVCCSVMQCDAMCCSVMQCVAVCCSDQSGNEYDYDSLGQGLLDHDSFAYGVRGS